jgi:hypothetical protein
MAGIFGRTLRLFCLLCFAPAVFAAGIFWREHRKQQSQMTESYYHALRWLYEHTLYNFHSKTIMRSLKMPASSNTSRKYKDRCSELVRNQSGADHKYNHDEGRMAKRRKTRKTSRARTGALNALFDAAPKSPGTRDSVPLPPSPPPDIFTTSDVPTPNIRPLKVYAFDPSVGQYFGNYMSTSVRYEEIGPGPVGERFAVIDYDGTNKTLYKPIDLNDPKVMVKGGFDPSQFDPRFHQQMVYAVASETLQRFEYALGRRVGWKRTKPGTSRRLNLFPHAMCEANAFYSPDAHGILFGYFRASRTQPGHNLPGQVVFTCLSHDIIAHETTHAIVDGIRQYFTEPTNIDVPAFHEAFADLSALFSHFAHKEALLDTMQKTGGKLFQFQMKPDADIEPATKGPVLQSQISEANPLIQLALQFGGASGMRTGLRSALGTPANSEDIKVKTEPHDRGSILVAAVFDAYFSVYTRRTADLYRIYRAGGGSANPVDLPEPLADRLAAEASQTADEFFIACARALDYCPPVDITFGDFLRAVLTADLDLHPADPDGVRDALMQAFRSRGIVAEEAKFFSEESLCWPRVQPQSGGKGLPAVVGLQFGDPNGLTKSEKDANGEVLRAYAKTNAKLLGFAPAAGKIDAPSFHPMFHMSEDGQLFVDMVVELVQTINMPFDDPDCGTFPLRNGVTLLISQEPVGLDDRPPPKVLFAIQKLHTKEREDRIRTYYQSTGRALGSEKGDNRFRIDFGLLHAGG